MHKFSTKVSEKTRPQYAMLHTLSFALTGENPSLKCRV